MIKRGKQKDYLVKMLKFKDRNKRRKKKKKRRRRRNNKKTNKKETIAAFLDII